MRVFRVANAGYGVRTAKFTRNNAAKKIDFVCGSCGDQKIAVFHIRKFLHLERRAVAVHDHNVQFLHRLPQNSLVAVDYDNIVTFFCQLLCQCGTNLSVPDDRNPHDVDLHSNFYCCFGRIGIKMYSYRQSGISDSIINPDPGQ